MDEELTAPEAPPRTRETSDILRKGFRGSVAIMVGRVVAGAAGIVFSIYTVRMLTIEEYAAWGVIRRSFLPFAILLTSFGLNPSLLRFIPELMEKGANAALRRLLFFAGGTKIAVALLLAAALVIFYGPIERVLDLPQALRPVLPVTVAFLIGFVLTEFLTQGVLPSFLDQTFYSAVTMLMVIGYTVAAVWALRNGYGLAGVLWSQVAFIGLAVVALAVRAGRLVAPILRAPPGMSMNIRKRVRRFAGINLLIAAGAMLRSAAVDVLVISAFLGDSDVALYTFASGVALMAFAYTPMANVGTVLTPIMAREYSRTKDPGRLAFFFRLSTKLVLHTSVPLMVALFVFLPNVITDIYQRPEYLGSLAVGRLFVAYMIVKLLSSPFAVLYQAIERPEFSMYAHGFAVLNVVLLFFLVPAFGINGAAIATCGVAPLLYFYQWFVFLRILRVPVRFPWKAAARVGANLIVPAALGVYLAPRIAGPWLLAGVVFLLGALYLGFALLNRIFDDRERMILGTALGRWRVFL